MGTCHSSFLEVSQLQLCTPTKVSEPVKRRDEHTSAATRRVFDFVTERAHYRSVLCLAVSPLKTCPDTGHKLLYIYIYLIPSINHPSNLPLFRPIFSCSNKPRPENHFPFHLHSNIYIYIPRKLDISFIKWKDRCASVDHSTTNPKYVQIPSEISSISRQT